MRRCPHYFAVAAVLCCLLPTGLAYGHKRRWSVVLHGPAARKAVERALLPYIMQFRLIKSIQFTAEIRQNYANDTVAFLQPRFKLEGIYKFWADGDRYRIDWQVLKSNYQPVVQQLWTFDGRRYESLIGAGGELVVSHRRNIGGMGPGESNPILSPIQNLCWRATARQPGDWLNWRRVRQFPHAVDKLPKAITVGFYEKAGDKIEFNYHYSGLRWPIKWPRKSPPPPSFRPAGPIWSVVEMQSRGNVWLPVAAHFEHAAMVAGGRRVGGYYQYRAFHIDGTTLYLLHLRIGVGRNVKSALTLKHLRVNGRIDPAVFTINFDRAPAYFDRDRIINISRLPAAPARTQHLGKTR